MSRRNGVEFAGCEGVRGKEGFQVPNKTIEITEW